MTEPGDAPGWPRGAWLGLAAVLSIAAVAVFGAFVLDLDEVDWLRRIEDEIAALGPYGVIASIALMVVHSFVPFVLIFPVGVGVVQVK